MARLNSWVRGGNYEGKPGYIIEFDYDAETIAKIKDTIPPQFREWRPEEKSWWVSEYCEKQINDIFPGFLEAITAQRTLF
jgi:hypothetical protein